MKLLICVWQGTLCSGAVEFTEIVQEMNEILGGQFTATFEVSVGESLQGTFRCRHNRSNACRSSMS